ncbi:MAG: 50S ribosomal protein L19 [Verrucomicrobiota bacterium]|nr:50S ribosomal protein L19 [Opitutales bacterium]UPA28146.1 MAG: 50S ribosomal protein L19 [Verrucomicrobiota bacterium]
MNRIIEELTAKQLIAGRDHFKVGDGVRVHVKVREGDKERIQIFSGIVIAKKHGGISETFTVRRVVAGEGVERVFPKNSPSIAKIEVERESIPMRAKLYYIRKRIGKDAMKVRERKR